MDNDQLTMDNAQLAPAGYKRTEVGVIPEGWEVKTAAEICSKIQDGTHFSPSLEGNDNLYITSKNIGFGTLDVSTAERIDASQHKAIYSRCDVKKGDLLLTKDGANTGNAALNHLEEEVSLLSSIAFLRFDPRKHIAGYYLQQILSPGGQKRIKESMAGNAITRLTLAKIRKLRFPVPPLPEQRAIAEVLSDVDALITALDRLIAKKRAIKQGAMQQLLTGKTRLPGFSGPWKAYSIGDNSTLNARIGWHGLTTDEYLKNGEYYLVTGTDFVDGTINWNRCHFVNKKRYDQDENIQLESGDVLITKDGTIGKVAYIDHLPGEATLNSGVFVIRPKDDVYNSRYLYHVLSSHIFRVFLKQLQAGSTISHLYQKDFVNFEFLAPPPLEQRAIAAVLSDIDAEIAALEARRDKTRALKQGMMQELLTGRTHLI